MQKLKVENMYSKRSPYKAVANQFIITTPEGEYFQSYRSVIAFRRIVQTVVNELPANRVEITLDETYWNYSRTTSKYRGEFLGESTDETRKKIESGEYVLANLNA